MGRPFITLVAAPGLAPLCGALERYGSEDQRARGIVLSFALGADGVLLADILSDLPGTPGVRSLLDAPEGGDLRLAVDLLRQDNATHSARVDVLGGLMMASEAQLVRLLPDAAVLVPFFEPQIVALMEAQEEGTIDSLDLSIANLGIIALVQPPASSHQAAAQHARAHHIVEQVRKDLGLVAGEPVVCPISIQGGFAHGG